MSYLDFYLSSLPRQCVVNAYDASVTLMAHGPGSENEIVYVVAAASCGYGTPATAGALPPGPAFGDASGDGSGDGAAPNAPSAIEALVVDVSVPA
jgi:hypothetical protein